MSEGEFYLMVATFFCTFYLIGLALEARQNRKRRECERTQQRAAIRNIGSYK